MFILLITSVPLNLFSAVINLPQQDVGLLVHNVGLEFWSSNTRGGVDFSMWDNYLTESLSIIVDVYY